MRVFQTPATALPSLLWCLAACGALDPEALDDQSADVVDETVSALDWGGNNIVSNGSFEEYAGLLLCDNSLDPNDFERYFKVRSWMSPTCSHPDLFSLDNVRGCFAHPLSEASPGPERPRTGKVAAGIFTYGAAYVQEFGGAVDDYREYLQVALAVPLVPGRQYVAEYYVSRAERARYASGGFGMYFSKGKFFSHSYQALHQLTPQVSQAKLVATSEGWERVWGTFVATEAADHLVIGNFSTDGRSQNTVANSAADNEIAYYYVDDVAVYQATPLYCSASARRTDHVFINRVAVPDIGFEATTGDNDGYLQANQSSRTPLTLTSGERYQLRLDPGHMTSAPMANSWSVWIDFNADGDFTDSGEQVVAAASVLGGFSRRIRVPHTVVPGPSRMRIVLAEGKDIRPPCGRHRHGEVEDYAVLLVDAP